MATETVKDQDSRIRAATDFASNLVVVAGAGTGKTSLLVERFLNLTLSGHTSVERAAAITFTEKAATEMRERVAGALAALTSLGEPGETPALELEAERCRRWLGETRNLNDIDISGRAAEALSLLDRAFIGTIHAFCANLLRRNAFAADIPPTFTVDDGITQDTYFEELWLDFLTEEFRTSRERARLWERVLETFTEREVEGAARSLAQSAGACDMLAREGYGSPDPVAVLGERIRALLEDLRKYHDEVPGKLVLSLLIKTQILLLECLLEGGPEALQATANESLPFKFWGDKKPPAKVGKSLPEDRVRVIENRVREATDLLFAFRKVKDASISELMDVLRPFAVRFRERIHQEGLLSFDDLLLMTRNLLQDHPDIRKAESERVHALLVDEFQDTDPLQYDIVFLLASDASGPVQDPTTLPLNQGKLFLVGDPKQSIYRFRGADYSAYRNAAEHVLDGAGPEALVTNFRSRPGIVAAVNRLFDRWTGEIEAETVSPPFDFIQPHREAAGDDPAVEIWSILGMDDENIEPRRRAEAREIARAIRTWSDENALSFKDVAILFRALSDVPIYTRALREEGVDFVLDGGRAFADRPEVVESLALLRALANPSDPVATLAVLRSTLGGVPDRELAAFVRAGGRFRWKGKNPTEDFPRISTAFDRLREWDHQRSVLPLDRWIQKTLTESEYSLLLTAYFDGPQRVANVKKLAEKAASLVREHRLTLEQTLDVLKDQYSGERVEGESPLADEAINAVRVLTIHKAKGLEFPVIIIPDLARTKPQEAPRTEVRLVRSTDQPRIAVSVAERSWLRNTASVIASLEDKSHEAAEEKRVFYVAATRARDKLILVNSSTTRRNPWQKSLAHALDYRAAAGFQDLPDAGFLPGDLVFHRKLVPAPSLTWQGAEEPVDVTAALEAFLEARDRDALPYPRFRHPSHDHRPEILESEEHHVTAATGTPGLARPAGIAVHHLLESMNFTAPEVSGTALNSVVQQVSLEHGVESAALKQEVSGILDGFFSSSLVSELAEVKILGREVPMLRKDSNDTIVFGYADLVFDQDGVVHVADYKTDTDSTPERAEAYREQLEDYAAALRIALDLSYDPTMEIFFLRTGTRAVIPTKAAAST